MSHRYPVTLGGIIPDASVRKPVETLVNDLNRSGVWRRYWTVPLSDVGGGIISYEFDEDDTSEVVTGATYVSGTGVSVTVTPFSGQEAVVIVSGGATVEGNGLASDGWCQISDGTNGYAQQRVSIGAATIHPISCAYTGAISGPTTFTLQLKKNLVGDANYLSYRRHLAVTAFQQADTSYRIPVHVGRGNAEVIRGAKIVSIYGRARSGSDYTAVKLGVQNPTGTEILATYTGRTQSLEASQPFDMNGSPLDTRLLDGQIVILDIERHGVPPSLVGMSVEVAIDLIGT